MTRIISVVSGKGGVGKTTLVANLGSHLSSIGKDVAVIDANLSGANLGLHLGLSDFYPFAINHVLKGDVPMSHATYNHYLGFDIIPASLSDIDVNPNRLKHVLKDVVGKKDFVLIDAAAGIDNEVKAAIEASDEVLLVTNPDTPSIADALRAKKLAENLNKTVMGVVLNKVRGERFEITDKVIEDVLELPIIAKIPEHKKVREAIALKIPMTAYAPRSKVSVELKKLSHHLTGEEMPKESLLEKFINALYR
ncbi:MAG: P-loop NTPase [Candidatus Micrarchaeota archaeon]|nr:P-loop NTPase [Candidatus Micrarchaeota archaeon]